MAVSLISRKRVGCWCLAGFLPLVTFAQANYLRQGGEYAMTGGLPGDQVLADVAVSASGGYVVWEDNFTDGEGAGIGARRLDGNLWGTLSAFRVNQEGAGDQQRPRVALLPDGGAVFVWQGGQPSAQRIFARFLSASNTWATGDVLVNTFTNQFQITPAVAGLPDGGAVVVWASYNQEEGPNSLQGVFGRRLSASGSPLGGEFRINQFTTWNQRSPAVAALAGGGFVVVWVSEQQRFEESVDIYGRLYNAAGAPLGGEFLINTGTNVCAHPAVAAFASGGFVVAWSELDLLNRSNNWDIVARTFSAAGVGGPARLVNSHFYGDQFAPKVCGNGTDVLVVWTSLGQDGSREGVFGQILDATGALVGTEFRVNTTTVSQQMFPAVAADGRGRFLALWSGFVGGSSSFELFGQQWVAESLPLPTPAAPFISALDAYRLLVAWPKPAGLEVATYELYADGATSPSAVVTSNMWRLTGLNPGSTHTVRLAYVLADGRRSALSPPASGTTWGRDDNYDGLPDDWQTRYWGENVAAWPSPFGDSDGDGVSDRNEFLAGTNPTDARSVLRVTLQATAQGLYLQWQTQPGQVYQVQVSTNWGQWTNLGEPRFAAGETDSLYVGGDGTAYYRLLRVR